MTTVPKEKLRLLNRDDFFNFIELNITGDNLNYIKCDSESKYIDADIFNVFASCFEASNSLFEFYGNTKYNSRNIIRLKNELLELKEKLDDLNSIEELMVFLRSVFLGKDLIEEFNQYYKNWEKNWKMIKEILLRFNSDLLKVVDQCISEDRVLWVIGL